MHWYEVAWHRATTRAEYIEAWCGYLASAEWRPRHAECLASRGGRCGVPHCEQRAVQAHHRTYARRFHELPTDLLPVCLIHHRRLHARSLPHDVRQGELFPAPPP